MNSADSSSVVGYPHISSLDVATTYRDNHFFKSFNNPDIVVRPVIPISNFMTHGILHAGKQRFFVENRDPINDWMNYVMMYYGRGTLLKELYLDPSLFSEEMWKALGTATAWAQKNEDKLKTSVLVGGDANKGEVYGYVSFDADHGILPVRNPGRSTQKLVVPFDRTVYYRGAKGKPFHAKTIFPYREEMPWTLKSGESFTIEVPGDSVHVYDLVAGAALSQKQISAEPLPTVKKSTSSGTSYEISLEIPDELFAHYELLLYQGEKASLDKVVTLFVDGKPVKLNRSSQHGVLVSGYDLRPYRGKTLQFRVRRILRRAEFTKVGLLLTEKW